MAAARAPSDELERTTWERRRRTAAVVVLVLAAATAVVAAYAVVTESGDPEPDRVLVAGGLALGGLVVLMLLLIPAADRAALSRRMKSVSVGPVGIELADYAEIADDREDEDAGEEDDGTVAETLFELRVGLEKKLAYLAKHVLAAQPDPEAGPIVPAYLTVGSLRHDGYLTAAHARIAYDVLTVRPAEVGSLTETERRLFFAGAQKLVDTIRIEVFSSQVRHALDARGWRVLEAFPGSRRDLLVQARAKDDATQHHVIPVFALSAQSHLLDAPGKRLRTDSCAKLGGRGFLVVPPLSEASAEADGVHIATLGALLDEIGFPPDQR